MVLERLIAEAPQRVAVTTFASNVARLQAPSRAAAQRAGRDVVVVGRAIRRAVDVAARARLSRRPAAVPRPGRLRLPAAQQGRGADDRQPGRAARGARRASPPSDHREVTLSPGDRVIFSSRTIPGNERAVNAIINALVDFGAEVITDRDALVHTSGHPRRDELRQLYDWTKPQIVVPVHGEALHLHEQAKLARAAGVPQVVEIAQRPDAAAGARAAPSASTTSTHGRLYRDGRLLVSHEESGVGDRRRLSFAGRRQRRHRAVRQRRRAGGSGGRAARRARQPIAEGERSAGDRRRRRSTRRSTRCRSRSRRDAGLVREAVRRAVRGEIDAAWGKKPPTIVHVDACERLSERCSAG